MSVEYRVIKIIDEYNIVINYGANDGAKDGERLDIFVPGQSVIDPVTGENLGTLDYVKAKIMVKDAFPKMSVCVNVQTTSNAFLAGISNVLGSHPIALNVSALDISGGFENADSEVHVGDLVRLKTE